jgi:hypothetical protein
MQAPLQPEHVDACAGLFRLSRLLHVAVRLGVAPALASGPRDARQLAAELGTHAPTTSAFLDALAAWGVFQRDDQGCFALTPVSQRLLPGEPGGANLRQIAGWVGLDAVFEAWADLEHTLRTGECALRRRQGIDFHARLANDAASSAQYQDAMSSTAASFDACAAALDALDVALIVDLGGGRGDLLEAVLQRHPKARGLCVDLPHVVQGLTPRLDGRLRFVAADALEQVPPGADLYLTSTVLRCFGDDEALAMLRATRRAMTHPDARLVCFEMVLPPAKVDPAFALANMTAHVVYGGRDRTAEQFRVLMGRAGLACQTIAAVDGAVHAIAATRAEHGGSQELPSSSSTRHRTPAAA